jgi:hypothetical protein
MNKNLHHWKFDVVDTDLLPDCPCCHSALITYDGKHMLCPNAAADHIAELEAALEKLADIDNYNPWGNEYASGVEFWIEEETELNPWEYAARFVRKDGS